MFVADVQMVDQIKRMLLVGSAVLERLRTLDDIDPFLREQFEVTADCAIPVLRVRDDRKYPYRLASDRYSWSGTRSYGRGWLEGW